MNKASTIINPKANFPQHAALDLMAKKFFLLIFLVRGEGGYCYFLFPGLMITQSATRGRCQELHCCQKLKGTEEDELDQRRSLNS